MLRKFWNKSNIVSKNLFAYDYLVNNINCNIVWNCNQNKIIQHYDSNITNNHIEIGQGTGYFLKKNQYNTLQLMDINNDILGDSSKNLKANSKKIHTHCHNIFSCSSSHINPSRSIGLTYVLHCVPGKIENNLNTMIQNIQFDNYNLFGASVVQDPVETNILAETELLWLNRLGIFNNENDTYNGLHEYLEESGMEYNLRLEGYVAIFDIKVAL